MEIHTGLVITILYNRQHGYISYVCHFVEANHPIFGRGQCHLILFQSSITENLSWTQLLQHRMYMIVLILGMLNFSLSRWSSLILVRLVRLKCNRRMICLCHTIVWQGLFLVNIQLKWYENSLKPQCILAFWFNFCPCKVVRIWSIKQVIKWKRLCLFATHSSCRAKNFQRQWHLFGV